MGLAMLKPGGGGLTGEVRIGATHTFNIGLIPECVAQFLARHPTVRVRVEELPADQIGSKLHAGELDIGIAYRPNGPTDLWFEPLYNEEMVLVVCDTHPLAGRRRIRMVELHQQRLMLMLIPDYFSTRALLDECFKASGAEPVVVAEMSTIAPMLGLVLRTQIGAIVAINAVPADADSHAGHSVATGWREAGAHPFVRGDRAQDGVGQQPAARRARLTRRIAPIY